MTDLFNAPDQEIVIDPTKDYLPELVGDDKKFKTPTDLARAKVEADAFIERLKRENALARKELEDKMSMKQFMDNLNSKLTSKPAEQNSPVTNQNEPDAATQIINKGISEEDIVKILESRERAKQEQQNIMKATEAVKKAFGANYVQVLEQKAQELGVAKAFLEDVAKSNVSAFLKVVGAEQPADNNAQVFPKGSVSHPNTPAQVGKSAKDFEKLRRENFREWLTPRVQNEIYEQMMKQGESFYS
jgi:hypothetical protein